MPDEFAFRLTAFNVAVVHLAADARGVVSKRAEFVVRVIIFMAAPRERELYG